MKKRSFTLIELLVVVAIIAVLIAILLPALQKVRNKTKLVQCSTSLRQVGQGVFTYSNDFSGFAPVNHNFFGNFQHVAWYGGWWNFGLLFGCKMIEDPKALYCPGFEGTWDSDTPAYEAAKGEWKRPPTAGIIRIPYTYLIPHIQNDQNPFEGGWNFSYKVEGAKGWGWDGSEGNYKYWSCPIEKLSGFTIGSDLLYAQLSWTHWQDQGFNALSGDGSVKFCKTFLAENHNYWPGWWSGGTRAVHWFFDGFEKGL